MSFKRHINNFRLPLIATVVALMVIVSGGYLLKVFYPKQAVQSHPQLSAVLTPHVNPSMASIITISAVPAKSTIAVGNPSLSQQAPVSNRTYYGHFAYVPVDSNQLIIIASYATREYQRFESLASEAAKALMKMIYAARDEKVWIVPVSGFRTIEEQQKLFEEQIKRRGSPKEAAKVSAPPGYSEHHTGYAVDLTDGHFPKQDITLKFENTDAFRWLNLHAKEFGFELSFYNNNPQGVSYESWHWRYVDSPKAAAIFAQGRRQ